MIMREPFYSSDIRGVGTRSGRDQSCAKSGKPGWYDFGPDPTADFTMNDFRNARAIKPRTGLLVAAWAATLLVLGWWLARTPEATLRDQLMRWQFWALELQFIALLVLSWINLPAFVRSIGICRRDFVFPAAAAGLALGLVTWVAPQTSRIYYDEQIYQGIGQNLSDLRLAQMCNDGNVEYGTLQCSRSEYNKQPYGYPYLLSIAYRLGGVRDGTAFAMNTIMPALVVLVVFLSTTALSGERRAGNYASLVAALIPEQLRWSHTAAAEPSAAFACALAVMTALAFVRMRSTPSLLWMISASVFALQFRPECILVLPVVALVVLLDAPGEFVRSRLWWGSLVGLMVGAAHIGHLVAVRNEGWGTPGPRMSGMFVANNIQTNGWFYLGDPRFPVVFSLLAISALVTRRRTPRMLIPLIHFLLFWGIFLFFYAGSYNYGADDRFSLMTYAPLAMMAGVGAWRLVDRVAGGSNYASTSERVAVVALCAQFLWYMPLVRTVGEEAWGARADVDFARHVVKTLPKNSIVLTHNPNMFHIWGQSAAQASVAATEPGYAANILAPRYAGGVFFHWNFWCNVSDPVQQSFCTQLLAGFPHTLVREYRERDYRYAIYRLDLSSAPGSAQR
jgi:hypothetical protein